MTSLYPDLVKRLDETTEKLVKAQSQMQVSPWNEGTIKELLKQIPSLEQSFQNLKELCHKILSDSTPLDVNEWEVISDENNSSSTKETKDEELPSPVVVKEKEASVGKINEFHAQRPLYFVKTKPTLEGLKNLQVSRDSPKSIFESNPEGYMVLEDEKFKVMKEVFDEFKLKENNRLLKYYLFSAFTRILVKLDLCVKVTSPDVQSLIHKMLLGSFQGKSEDIDYLEFEKHTLSLLMSKKIIFNSHKRLCYLKNL